MSEEDFKKAIFFKERDVPEQNAVTISARVSFGFDVTVSKDLRHLGSALAEARRVASESILRRVYEDRRDEFYAAIEDLHMINPMDYKGFHERIERVLILAKRQ